MTGPAALVVTSYWPPHVGGIESVASEQARRLSRRGWRVSVATSRIVGDSSVEQMGSVIIRRYRCLDILQRVAGIPVPLVGPSMLASLIRSAREVDVVVAHGHVYLGSVYAALATRLSGTPFVLVQHAPFVKYGPILDRLERLIDRTLGSWVVRSATSIVAVSDFTANFVRSLVPEAPTVIIRSSVDKRRFFPSRASRSSARPVVLTIRRLVPRNGVDVLVRAWRVSDLGRRADLLVGGSGPEAARVESEARGDESIRLLGHVPDQSLPDLYRSADLFVLPSRSGEGFGLVALEAMASGLPVVATSSGGITDLVVDGVNGRVVPPEDPVALGRAITDILGDPATLARLRAGALASADASSWEASIDNLEETLLAVAGFRRHIARDLVTELSS
jgi:D-inositol-3-phosphate glycosyltransferase